MQCIKLCVSFDDPGTMASIMVHGTSFRTKTALRDYVRKKLARIQCTSDLRTADKDFYRFVLALFERHPNVHAKLEKGVARIQVSEVGRSARGDRYYGFVLNYEDGTRDDISWQVCVTGKSRSNRIIAMAAMRQAIQDQIWAFRADVDMRTWLCPLCGCGRDGGGADQVDHEIPFCTLADAFAAKHGWPLTRSDVDSLYRNVIVDADYAEKWSAHHREHARLQLLCLPCNQKKAARQ